MNGGREAISTQRLYGSAIALVSGGYSLYLSWTGPEMTTQTWAMILIGVIVIAHGIVLLTPAAERIAAISGPLMIGYALVMVALQWWMDMEEPDMMGEAMSADPGMVAIALLMLLSGIIMTRRQGSMSM